MPPPKRGSEPPVPASSPPNSPRVSPQTSPPGTPLRPRRNPSTGSAIHQHAPLQPSTLRESHLPRTESEDNMAGQGDGPLEESSNSNAHEPQADDDAIRHTNPEAAPPVEGEPGDENTPLLQGGGQTNGLTRTFWGSFGEPSARSRLLKYNDWDQASGCGSDDCKHGTFSPRPRSYGSMTSQRSDSGFGGRYPGGLGDHVNDSADTTHGLLGDTVADGLLGGGEGPKMSTTQFLAKRHGVKSQRAMYMAYYIPIFNWIQQYKWSYLSGDFIAALTMASFYIPMSLSYASNLAHLPPINGLYSFVFNPILYAVLGSCPQMVVGPEAAGSLLTGEVIRENIERGDLGDHDGTRSSQIAGSVTFLAGAIIMTAGFFRLGFLDNVLSRPFLRGFISAIGFVIFFDQLIPELGLADLASQAHVSHASTARKLIFLVTNLGHAQALTTAVSLGSFAIIMVCREIKRHLQPKYPRVAYVPDRFIIVLLSAIITWKCGWDKKGLEVLGNVKTSGSQFKFHNPLAFAHINYVSDAFSTAFVIALLGFFESSVAAKSLGTGPKDGQGIQNMSLSANRELVALGVANVTGGLFMALPAFGGYGRSKVNASTGGRTPMSSIFLSIITIICIEFLLPYFFYLPKGVLSAMISVVAYSLIEEAPSDIAFFIRIRGFSELTLMLLIFLATILWNLKFGIAVGVGLSLLRVIRHGTRPRVQILGRVPGSSERFENAEAEPGRLEFVEGCLIVKIPEPLTFANTGDLKGRLRRLEEHGTGSAHPALPRVRREEHNRNVIFDVHGVTSLDGAGAQVLSEIVRNYRERGVRVFFCRLPGKGTKKGDVWKLFVKSGIVDMCGGEEHFVDDVRTAINLTDVEDGSEEGEREIRERMGEREIRERMGERAISPRWRENETAPNAERG